MTTPQQAAADGGTNPLAFPREMTNAVAEVLGLMNFQTGPIAHGYRAAGHDIKKRCEDEQAFVLHRFLLLALEHGPDWRKHAAEDMRAAAAEVRRQQEGR